MNLPEDIRRFTDAIEALCAGRGRDCDHPTLTAYKIGLEDIDIGDIERAVLRAIRECKFLPSPAELREMAGCGSMSLDDRAAQAWLVVDRAVGDVGAYESVNFDDPAINATIRSLGGWPKLCDTPLTDFAKWTRKDFLATYKMFCRNLPSWDACRTLAGLGEDDPVRITTNLSPTETVPVGMAPREQPLAVVEGLAKKLTYNGGDDV